MNRPSRSSKIFCRSKYSSLRNSRRFVSCPLAFSVASVISFPGTQFGSLFPGRTKCLVFLVRKGGHASWRKVRQPHLRSGCTLLAAGSAFRGRLKDNTLHRRLWLTEPTGCKRSSPDDPPADERL